MSILTHAGRFSDLVLEALTEEHILEFLHRCGVHEQSKDERHFWFPTVCHGGDSHKLCYNRDSKSFYCYTRCGYVSLFTLVQRLLGCNFYAAVEAMGRLVGMDRRHTFGGVEWIERAEIAQLERYVKARKPKIDQPFEFPIINENILRYYQRDVFYSGWIEEGISIDVMEEYDICWDEPLLAVIIPHRDGHGNLIGLRKRPVHAIRNKYTPVVLQNRQYAHPLGMNLYGLHKARDTISKTHKVLLVEGEKSVLKHASMYGTTNAVALCGFHITDMQRQMLLHLGVEEVTLGFDKDYVRGTEQENVWKRKVQTIAQMLTPFMRVYALVDRSNMLGLKDSPLDKGKEVFESMMRSRVPIATNW